MGPSEIEYFLKTKSKRELFYLLNKAEKLRKKFFDNKVYIRAIIEFSNICIFNCNYCGIRKDNSNLERYFFSLDEAYENIDEVVKTGIKTIVFQSGQLNWSKQNLKEYINNLITYVKEKEQIAVTLSLGEAKEEIFKEWKSLGADRYLLKQETYDEEFFKFLHPDDDFKTRLQCRKILKKLGYQTGTGLIIGLPNQTVEIIVKDLILLSKEEPDMIGTSPFIPHPNTIFANTDFVNKEFLLKVLAITRILNPKALMPSTTATFVLWPDLAVEILEKITNVVMLDATIPKFRNKYKIYPGKGENLNSLGKELGKLERILTNSNLIVDLSIGHSLITKRK